jgi:S-adenosylmethionine:tRNA ribosyltransferase-isomerase
MPVPPYIKSQPANSEDYQTVYAREEGSVAAPTAGLHFTRELIEECNNAGIEHTFVRLHVGIGTFRPVKVEDVASHRMHAESYAVDATAAATVNDARRSARRVVAVGTTVVRVLESLADEGGMIEPSAGATSLFILPGQAFRCVDALITNFHLPRSTLLMLVAAFAGRETVRHAYQEAIDCKYRFYSFGDAMLLDD